jgi:UrcA family protein
LKPWNKAAGIGNNFISPPARNASARFGGGGCNDPGCPSIYMSVPMKTFQTSPGGSVMTRSASRFTAIIGALALATLALAAIEASAASTAATADGIVVKYSEQEISTDADAERLYRKIKSASRKACGLHGGFLNLNERTRAQACYDETLAEVVRKINRPQLTALHDSKADKVS